jgi:hypothetical protein
VPLLVGVVALYLLAAGMTLREPRLWEYHNELAGGSANAYRYFGNEGLDLGQRFYEIRAFHDRVIAPSGEPMYNDYWMGEEAGPRGEAEFPPAGGIAGRHQRRRPLQAAGSCTR